MADQWIMGLIGVGLILWGVYAMCHYMRTPGLMENVYLNDQFPQASQSNQVIALLEDAGYNVIGGKYAVPVHTTIDGKELEKTKIWIDMIAKRNEKWYIVRIARERMQLDWSASAIRKQWAAYFAAYPKCAGLLVVNREEKRVRELHIEFGEVDEDYNL